MIVKTIKKIIVGLLKACYFVLSAFNLQFALLVAIVGIVLYFTGTFENNSGLTMGYLIIFILSIVLAVFLSVRSLFAGTKKQAKNTRKIKLVKHNPSDDDLDSSEENSKDDNFAQSLSQEEKISSGAQIQQDVPTYYRVKQNSNYIMAEYSDRYELYFIGKDGLQKVRTDFKE